MKKTTGIRHAVNVLSAIVVYTVIYCSGTEIGNPEAQNGTRDQSCYEYNPSHQETTAQQPLHICLLTMDIMEYMKILY